MQTPHDTKEKLAINLKKLMDAGEVSAREVERRSGVSDRMVGYILKRERAASVEILEALAKCFRVSPTVLISDLSDLDIEHLAILEKLSEAERKEVSRYANYLIDAREKNSST